MSTTPFTRKYKGRDADMIITAATILDTALAHKDFLQSKRPAWQDPFFDNLKARIDNAATSFLGQDSAKDLRQATREVNLLIGNAQSLLADFKVQIDADYKKDKARREELLRTLGFADWFAAARNSDQSALIALLFQFKANMTPALASEITATGIDPALIESIMGRADALHQANIRQEALKGSRKELTQAAVRELNDIYDQTIGICTIAARFLKDDPAARRQFSFSAVQAALSATTASPAKKAARKAIAKIDPALTAPAAPGAAIPAAAGSSPTEGPANPA